MKRTAEWDGPLGIGSDMHTPRFTKVDASQDPARAAQAAYWLGWWRALTVLFGARQGLCGCGSTVSTALATGEKSLPDLVRVIVTCAECETVYYTTTLCGPLPRFKMSIPSTLVSTRAASAAVLAAYEAGDEGYHRDSAFDLEEEALQRVIASERATGGPLG